VNPEPDLLVVGAGPTGLALALQAAAHGARVRVVERRPERFRPSRALVVQPRTLEVLRPLGVVGALLERARPVPEVRLHLGRRVLDARLDGITLSGTPYPPLTLLRQADVEAVLADALTERGVGVDRGTELVDLEGALAVLRTPSGLERARSRFLAGCDGAAGVVRERAGIDWRGGAYRQEVVLADVELDGLDPAAAHAATGTRGLLFVFAAGENATWRLLATQPRRATAPAVPDGELQDLLDGAGLVARVRSVAWSARIPLQHRLATGYRRGRVFLAGDAAHVHSPAAAQGMNTGLQDAANLGWKLALAATASDPELLLDSYEAERRPVGRTVLTLTHLAFWAEAGTDPLASLLRGVVVPLATPVLARLPGGRLLAGEALRVLSGLWVGYRGSPLSVNGPGHGRWRAGDRLPDLDVRRGTRRVRLHALLARPGVHVLATQDGPPPCRPAPHVHVHRLAQVPGGGLLAVRPDGHVGFSSAADDAPGLARWLARVGAIGGWAAG
jgi:2-polyprenyl-6-methoxyphenol hydroxylase-like FAD-dependent oxidoreductase